MSYQLSETVIGIVRKLYLQLKLMKPQIIQKAP